MDTLEKIRVLLPHWLEHNRQHMEEFGKWESLLRSEGKGEVADALAEVVRLAEKTSEVLEKALDEVGGPVEGHHHHHHHGEG